VLHDQQLVFEEKGLRNEGPDPARTEQLSHGGNEMDEENGKIAHQGIVAGRRILRNPGRNNNSPATTGISMFFLRAFWEAKRLEGVPKSMLGAVRMRRTT
jgi:hypothetical protein